MKAAEFDYARAASADEACRLLAGAGGEGRIIAGGQTLVPLMAMRLVRPALLVDINAVAELRGIEAGENHLNVQAATPQADALANLLLRRRLPLLTKALGFVGHVQTRNRGTIGGSLAHADPAAELAAVALACDATIIAQGPQGQRRIAVADFFCGALTTALTPAELVIALELPCMPTDLRWGFAEFARRRGDFALAGAVVHFSLDAAGAIIDPHIAGIGASDRPRRLTATETVLAGQAPSLAILRAAADVATAETDAADDLHGSAAYRRSLAGTMVLRALADACAITLP